MISTFAAFIVYSAVVLFIGLWATRLPQKTPSEIHLGNRDHGTWTSALSTSASTESGWVLLGMVGMGYSIGVNCFWSLVFGVMGYSLNWYIMAPQLRRKSEKLNAITIPEFIITSTGNTAVSRLTASIASALAVFFLLIYVSAQFSAAGKALSSQFNISYTTAVACAVTMIAAYAVLGGFRAVSWTDNIQALMMVFALVILPLIIVKNIGGFGNLIEVLHEKDPTLVHVFHGASSVRGMFISIAPWLMIGLGYSGQPHAIARLMATKDDAVLRRAPIIAMIWMVIVYSGAIILGMAARVGYEHLPTISADPETALPVLAVELMPGVLAGVTLAAIIAAISSTADSTLLSATTTVTRDIRATLGLPPAKNELLFNRLMIVTLALLSAYFAMRETHVIFQFVLVAFYGLGASLGPVLLYCSLNNRPAPVPALLGVVTGGALILIFRDHELNFLISFFAGLIAIFIGHAFYKERKTS
ncbi:sodium/proline symporter [Candidatus Latescibacterota bacterium]